MRIILIQGLSMLRFDPRHHPHQPQRRLLGAAALAALGVPAIPAARAADDWQPATLPQGLQRDIDSSITGQRYRIYLSVPTTPAPPSGHPVLYALDGNATFPALALMARSTASRSMVGEAQDLAGKLTGSGSLSRVQFHLMAKENHGSAMFPAMARGMEFFLG